jgi:hypothetical protein
VGSSDTLLTVTLGLSGRLNGLYNLPSFREREYVRIENVFILELVVWPFGSIVSLEPRRRGNKAAIERNMGAADQIVDSISSTNNNNSNNDGEFDDDLKRVSEVLESSKACVFSNPTFFLDLKNFSTAPKRAPKRSASKNF